MKTVWKGLLVLAIAIASGAYSYGQVYVKVRPSMPRVVRVESPGHGYIWVNEDWTPKGSDYEFIGGHWVMPPKEGETWVPGHWTETSDGWMWIPGQWR